MENKLKLLITLGCSFTEGVGCWDENTLPPDMNRNNTWDQKFSHVYVNNENNFHEKGWPNRLCKKLGYDKVINLGLGGSSTSGQIKVFLEKYENIDTTKYDVLVVWLLTDPSRFSFYTYGGVRNVLPTINNERDMGIGSSYLDFIHDTDLDPLLEQIYHIKCLTNVCENKKYGLIITYWEERSGDNLLKQFDSPYFLYNKPHRLLTPYPYEDPYISIICGHPNELGYEMLANNIYEGIKQNHSKFIPDVKSESFEWSWDGKIIHHKKKFNG
jgi:hypothetical protein